MNSEAPENDLQRIKDEIRAEAEAARARAPAMPDAKPRPVVAANRAYDTSRSTYSIAEISRFHFTTFVDYAYRALLKRPPDAAGFDGHLRLLVSGGSKIEILGNLRYSPEGRAAGVRVPGLLPRYVLAKLYRVPVLGYLLEWIVSLAGLPMVVRHQRAADTFHTARSYEIDTARRELGAQVEVLLKDNVRLRNELGNVLERVTALRAGVERATAMRTDIERVSGESSELRHLVLSMNHWLASLRQNLSALELAEADEGRKSDTLYAEVAERVLRADGSRPARIAKWVDAFARVMPKPAHVLDLGSGDDWLALLVGHGFDASGVDPNTEIGARARIAGRVINVAEPSAVLARTADASLDGLTALATGSLLRKLPAATLLTSARRVLRPGGVLLFGFSSEPGAIADHLAGNPDAMPDRDVLSQALVVSGFVGIEHVTAADGALCVIARNPS